MIFNNLIINEKKFSQLNNYILSKNIPNGFLFYGNKGSGKFGHAIEFAAALLCKESKNLNACSKCNSCKKVKLNQHEGIHFILPLPKSNTINKTTRSGISRRRKGGGRMGPPSGRRKTKISIPY